MPTWTLSFFCAGLFDPRRWRWSPKRRDIAPLRAEAAPPAPSREVSARRTEAMLGFFPKLASWIDQHAFTSEMNEVNRYLSQAADLQDLERRIRDIERRNGTSRWYQ
jgi:hypothetical protein